MEENPVRIEFWGDEIVDIRYFNNETQKSVEKLKTVKIMPMYKFILGGRRTEDTDICQDYSHTSIPQALHTSANEEGYFEGIEIYQNYFNDDLVGILDYFKDYVLVFDETPEVYSKYEFVDKNFEEQLEENKDLAIGTRSS